MLHTATGYKAGNLSKVHFSRGIMQDCYLADQPLFTQVLRKSVTEPSPSRHPRAGVTRAQTRKTCLTMVGVYSTLFFDESAY